MISVQVDQVLMDDIRAKVGQVLSTLTSIGVVKVLIFRQFGDELWGRVWVDRCCIRLGIQQ